MKNSWIGIGAIALALSLVAGPSGAQPAPAGGIAGRVVETIDASTYTYVLVDDGSRRIWAAGPRTAVAVGDRVTLPPGTVMKDFHSKSLDRTFEEILFVGSIGVPSGEAAPPGGPLPAPRPAPGGQAAAPLDVAGIARAEGGQTVGEIRASKETGAGKPVLVRGRVVKMTAGVMGKNWIHVQDSSGDLTVTTTAAPKVGDTVLVRGTVQTDRDFGSGYRYDVIVEDASVTIE